LPERRIDPLLNGRAVSAIALNKSGGETLYFLRVALRHDSPTLPRAQLLPEFE